MLVYGREPRLPFDATLDVNSSGNLEVREYLNRIKSVRDSAAQRIVREQGKQEKRYNKGRKELKLKVGDQVMVYSPIRKVGKSEKLLHRWRGPYVVNERINSVNYEIRIRRGNKVTYDTVHVQRLKPYHQRN